MKYHDMSQIQSLAYLQTIQSKIFVLVTSAFVPVVSLSVWEKLSHHQARAFWNASRKHLETTEGGTGGTGQTSDSTADNTGHLGML